MTRPADVSPYDGMPAGVPGWGWACAALVVFAVGLEVVSGTAANSPVPGWAERAVPLGWPTGLRALWWLIVAAAAAGFRVAERRGGIRRRGYPLWLAVSAGPFAAFAAGVAAGAPWAAWH